MDAKTVEFLLERESTSFSFHLHNFFFNKGSLFCSLRVTKIISLIVFIIFTFKQLRHLCQHRLRHLYLQQLHLGFPSRNPGEFRANFNLGNYINFPGILWIFFLKYKFFGESYELCGYYNLHENISEMIDVF